MYNIAIKGIYLITRKITDSDSEPIYYIGQAKNIFERFHGHCEKNGSTEIDIAIAKYGITSFTFEILEEVKNQDNRDKREKEFIKKYIDKYGVDKLYNRQTGGKKGQKKSIQIGR